MEITKQPRGGHRPGAGRPKADYQTTTVSFRVRTEWAADIKKAVKYSKRYKSVVLIQIILYRI